MERRERVVLPIYGLDCAGAAAAIERALASTGGVLRAYVNPATETAFMDYDAGRTDPWLLTLAVEKAGYMSGPPVAA